MSIYWKTLQVVLAIATPLLAWSLLRILRICIELIKLRQEREKRLAEEIAKQPPFDDEAEFYKVPNPKMVGVKLKKNGAVVWDGAIDKGLL